MNSNRHIRKIPEEDRVLMSLKFLFEPSKCYEQKYLTKDGKEKTYINRQVLKRRETRAMTAEEINFVKTHSAIEISKRFGRSTSWSYGRIAGNYTV